MKIDTHSDTSLISKKLDGWKEGRYQFIKNTPELVDDPLLYNSNPN